VSGRISTTILSEGTSYSIRKTASTSWINWKGELLALGYVLRKKVKIKEEERQSMKCAEGTQTEEGSKWLKKKKRRNEVKEKQVVEREDQGRQSNKEDDRGQVSKWKKTLMGALEHLMEKKEEQVGEALKMRVMWT
jgi:hypothetical protein